MEIPINDLKRIIDRFENTIFPDDQTSVVIPILLDFTDLEYDHETVKTQNGDTLILKEWSVTEGYTGKQIEAVVTYVFRGGSLRGLQPGFVVLSIKRL